MAPWDPPPQILHCRGLHMCWQKPFSAYIPTDQPHTPSGVPCLIGVGGSCLCLIDFTKFELYVCRHIILYVFIVGSCTHALPNS